MAKKKINPKMQPGIRPKFRLWQESHKGDYEYGECPICGEMCQPDGGQYDPDDPDVQIEYAHCENCGTDFFVETTTVYRFGGIDRRGEE